MILPKNTQFNRKLHLLEGTGKILTHKNGVVYFYLETSPGKKSYFRCDENLFENQFETEANETDEQVLTNDEMEAILKYCKRYPY